MTPSKRGRTADRPTDMCFHCAVEFYPGHACESVAMPSLPPPPAPGNSDRMLMRMHFDSIQKEIKRSFTLDAA